MSANNIQLEKALLTAHEKISKLGKPEFSSLSDKIQYLIVSYRADGNPVGLHEVAHEAVDFLKAHQAANSKHISTKLIDDIAKAASGETAPEKPATKTAVKKETVKKETENTAKPAAPKKAAAKK